jgi:hypothetical protein
LTATALVAVSVNVPTSDEVVTARVDGQPVMQVDSAGETSATERAREVEQRIKG